MPTLRELIEANPAAAAAVAARDDAAAAALLNQPVQTMAKPGARLTETGILDLLGPLAGATAIAGLEAVAGGESALAPVMAVALRSLRRDPGIDFGNTNTWAMLDALQQAGALSAEIVSGLKAYGSQTVGVARAALGRDVTAEDVSREYLVERAAADRAELLAARTAAWEAAKQAHGTAAAEDKPALLAVVARTERTLRETDGGAEVIDGQ